MTLTLLHSSKSFSIGNRTGPIKIMNKGQSYINQNIDDHIIENDGINTSLDHGLGGTLTGAKR